MARANADVGPRAMSSAVKKSLHAALDATGFVTFLGEEILDLLMDIFAIRLVLDVLKSDFLAPGDGVIEPATIRAAPSRFTATAIAPIPLSSICRDRRWKTRRVASHHMAGSWVTNPPRSKGTVILTAANATRSPVSSTAAARTPEVPTSMPRARLCIAGRCASAVITQYHWCSECHACRAHGHRDR